IYDWPYSFAIRLPEWGRFRTRNYSGVFCLRRTPHGLLVANVSKGPAAVTADVCRQRLDAVDTEVDPKSGVAEPRAAEPGGSRIGGEKWCGGPSAFGVRDRRQRPRTAPEALTPALAFRGSFPNRSG